MKYLITESQKENIIKKYILSNFDRVDDVWFTNRSVYYAGRINGNRGEEIIINVLVNNLDDELTKTNLYELRQSIINKADKTFNLGYNRPNGGWAFSFSQKTIQKF
jgi:hypothetical protein